MSKNFPLISLVIPVYNTERFLEKCLKSAIAQDFPNLEILILNNGSTDYSQSLIDKYASLDSRIVTYIIPHVDTVKESKDNCYYRAKGEWIVTLDSDDAIEKEYVSKLWRRHIETNADIVTGSMISVDLDGKEYAELPVSDFNIDIVLSGKEAMRRTVGRWDFGMNGALVKRTLFNNLYIDNPQCQFYTDEVDGRFLLSAADKVAFTRARYLYTINPNSTGKKLSWTKYKYKIDSRRGLLPLIRKELGESSWEYRRTIYQSLGILLLTCNYIRKNKKYISSNDYLEFKTLSSYLFQDLHLLPIRHLYLAPIKFVTKMAMSMI
jgi:glycosyltransferase involved in cell wall biosynthesis